MFEIFAKRNKKPFVVSKEFVKEILERRKAKENQDIKEMSKKFEKNNLGVKQKVKRR